MSDPLESMLDRLEPVASEPPAAFLHAVARRRHRRRLTQAGAMVCVGIAVTVAWMALQPRPTPVVRPELGAKPPAPAPTSMLALRRDNASLDAEELSLPELPGPADDGAVSMGVRPDLVEQWLGR